MPRLCVDKLDVLLLDHTGKNISGTGMDTNIVGRVLNPSWDGFSEPTTPVIKAVGIHRLAEPSHGNGGGIRTRPHCRLDNTAHPLHTRFANIFGASIYEATMRPNPRWDGAGGYHLTEVL